MSRPSRRGGAGRGRAVRDARYVGWLSAVTILLAIACGEPDDKPDTDDRVGDSPKSTTSEEHAMASAPGDEHAPGEHADHGKPNRLVHEKSPYLLQHAYNPVDWYPWGEEALRRAREEDKPIFLSIGYSTCHWCHVMERESFENPEIAALMNEYFVCIKVDREERPDIDQLYMTAVQAMTGHGGWPMSVFLTPELEPYYAGTYFPPDDHMQRPGFPRIVTQLGEAWRTDRAKVEEYAGRVRDALQNEAERILADPVVDGDATLQAGLLDLAYANMKTRFDATNGGFSSAPKFPTPHNFTFLLRYANRSGDPEAIDMVRTTLDAMARGGIHDQLAGGFHRYSTDPVWLAPHFEKMLYDQAGLAIAYTECWLATDEPVYRRVAEGILDYVLAYMTDPGGGFYSAEDADSEGEEGTFYVWSAAEIDRILGPDRGPAFRQVYDVTDGGNWEGKNILRLQTLDPLMDDDQLAADRRKLLEVRDQRIRPHLDDKIITEWNGFMIEAMARAGRAFGEPRYVEAAVRAADFVLQNLRDENGRVLRHHRGEAANVIGYIGDYAYMGRALVALYESTFDPRWLSEAIVLAGEMDRLFSHESGVFTFSGTDGEKLLTPVIEVYDGAMPSGNSAAVAFLLRLGHLVGNPEIEGRGWKVLEGLSSTLTRNPSAYLEMMNGLDFSLGPITELVIAGDGDDETVRAMWARVRGAYLPNTVMVFRSASGADATIAVIPYLENQVAVEGKATAYVCQDYACKLPVHDADALAEQLGLEQN